MKKKVIQSEQIDKYTYKYVFEDLSYFTFNFVTFERWYYNKNGQYHREDGPAIVCVNGSKYWFKNGQLHREDGPAIVSADGGEDWYKNGQLHRGDGPAVVWPNGTRFWYKNNQRHREDGPAVVYADEYLNGKRYFFEQGWKAELKRRSKNKRSKV